LLELTHRLQYPDIGADVTQALTELKSLEREVSGQGERWYLVRISPYRTARIASTAPC
jgi:two-component system CheB/CheR fusion protein